MFPKVNPMKPQQVPVERVRIGATIRVLREKSGMDQDQLASAALLSRSYIANIEAGRKPVNDKLLAKLAEALGVPQIAIAAPAATCEDV